MDDPKPKRPFADPIMVFYGDIQQVTQSVGRMGAMDSGTMLLITKTR